METDRICDEVCFTQKRCLSSRLLHFTYANLSSLPHPSAPRHAHSRRRNLRHSASAYRWIKRKSLIVIFSRWHIPRDSRERNWKKTVSRACTKEQAFSNDVRRQPRTAMCGSSLPPLYTTYVRVRASAGKAAWALPPSSVLLPNLSPLYGCAKRRGRRRGLPCHLSVAAIHKTQGVSKHPASVFTI